MGSVWLVWCRHCNKDTTALRGKPDRKQINEKRRVNCSMCNRDIDPAEGSYRQLNSMRGLKPRSLLEVL